MANKKYAVLSPDGFTIEHKPHYRSMKARKEAFDQWVKRYEAQGYYSSAHHGRIPLAQLKDECHFLTLQGKETIIERAAVVMKLMVGPTTNSFLTK